MDHEATLLEPVKAVDHLAQAADLPGDLVDGDVRIGRRLVDRLRHLFWKQHEGMVLGAVAARLGGASITRGALRVAFWGAVAMGCTAVVGRLFGTVV